MGFGSLWMMLVSYPLMAVTQEISARIGRTTGQGLAGSLRWHYPPWLVQISILLLVVANVINLGADLGAMGDATAMVLGGPEYLYVLLFGAICVSMEVLLQYSRYVSVLKWLSLVLFAYFGTMLVVKVPWGAVARGLFVPAMSFDKDAISTLVAVLGTTISPYLFFWQSSQEAEDQRVTPLREPLVEAPRQARRHFSAFGSIPMSAWPSAIWLPWPSSSPQPPPCTRTARRMSRPRSRRRRRCGP